jgi:hypothetical protein
MAHTLKFDTALILADIADQGLSPRTVALRAKVAPTTVGRFLSGTHQTNKTAKALAKALGFTVKRYLVTRRGRYVVTSKAVAS